jgi:hypothetical protein
MAGALDHIIGSALLHRFYGNFFRTRAGNDHNRYLRINFLNRFENVQSLKPKNIEITENQVKPARLENFYKLIPGCCFSERKTAVILFKRVSDKFFTPSIYGRLDI